MNLPNKITFGRIILTAVILVILLFPFEAVGISLPNLFINESIVIDIRYFIAGFLFLLAVISDIIDGKLARKYEMETISGKIMDDIADRVLVDSTLIVLSVNGFISSIIPLVVVTTEVINNSIQKNCIEDIKIKRSIQKIQKFFIHTGIILALFYNLPFELVNFKVSDVLLMISSVLCIVISIQYVTNSKKYLKMQ
ncbi:MAG: CDP-alcohol phosphatidyltransferase family protein [Tenericutes bacterium]|nr:CDP-alcohol phosphatidyltransferase family protein [Mycoplasmatota bacterium]